MVVPDLEPDLPSQWQKLVERGAAGIHTAMGGCYDEHGPNVQREISLDLEKWCRSRIASVHRGGLADDAEAMLAFYVVSVCRNICPLHRVLCSCPTLLLLRLSVLRR